MEKVKKPEQTAKGKEKSGNSAETLVDVDDAQIDDQHPQDTIQGGPPPDDKQKAPKK
jgi:hypothetical protein